MSVLNRQGVLLPKAIIATLVGVAAGGALGVWSLRQPAATVNAAAPTVAAQTRSHLAHVESPTDTHRTGSNAAPQPDGDPEVLQRARMLAQRPDVTALMELRDDVVRRAAEPGAASSSSVKRDLDEIDVRLNEARLLRLKLDAEELRKADPTRSH